MAPSCEASPAKFSYSGVEEEKTVKNSADVYKVVKARQNLLYIQTENNKT